MATDIYAQVTNAFEAAKKTLNDDLKQNFYDAVQTRQKAFRQLNNVANANHSLYSGIPAASQANYDQTTFLPGAASLAEKALEKQKSNQEAWDEYMQYLNNYNEQIEYYNNLTKQTQNAINNFSGDNNS